MTAANNKPRLMPPPRSKFDCHQTHDQTVLDLTDDGGLGHTKHSAHNV